MNKRTLNQIDLALRFLESAKSVIGDVANNTTGSIAEEAQSLVAAIESVRERTEDLAVNVELEIEERA